jgi:general secretion pathway protein G
MRFAIVALLLLSVSDHAALGEPASPVARCDVREADDHGVVYGCGPLLVMYQRRDHLALDEVKAKLEHFSIPRPDDTLPSEREPFTISVDKRALPAVRVSGPTSRGDAFQAELVVDNREAGAILISCGGQAAAAAKCGDIVTFLVRNGAALTARQEAQGRTNSTKRIMANIKQAIAHWVSDNSSRCPASLKELVDARYVTKDVTDAWGHRFIWRCPAEHYPFTAELSSLGPDGKQGTGDDIESWQLER